MSNNTKVVQIFGDYSGLHHALGIKWDNKRKSYYVNYDTYNNNIELYRPYDYLLIEDSGVQKSVLFNLGCKLNLEYNKFGIVKHLYDERLTQFNLAGVKILTSVKSTYRYVPDFDSRENQLISVQNVINKPW
jgi:hypothetical protein